jgi:hypothetical protein
MSPVSNAQDYAIGVTGKRSSALPFDPIASRKADRPKFRLEDYERKDTSEVRHADSAHRERDSRTEATDSRKDQPRETDRPEARQADDNKKSEANSGKTAASGASRNTDDAVQSTPEQRTAAAEARTNTETPATVEAGAAVDKDKPAQAEPKAADKGTQQAGETADAAAQTSPAGVSAELTDVKKSPSTNVSSDASDETAAKEQSTISQTTETANVQTKAQISAEAQSQNATVPATAVQDAAAKNGAADKTADKAVAEPSRAIADPKLAALQKLTQPKAAPTQTPAAANGAEDKTAFTLPVPWPPQKSGLQTATTAVNGTAKPAADLPSEASARAAQAVAAAATNGKTTGPQTNAPDIKTAAPQAASQGKQAAAANAAAQNVPRIEIENPAAAKPQVSSDASMLIANNRAAADSGRSKQSFIPSQSETIAAVTALNSRVPQSNALGAAPQSNAVTAAVEKASAQSSGNIGQAAAAINVAANTAQSATPNTGAAPAPVPGQVPVGSAETMMGGRSQGGTGQSSLSEPGSNAGGTARTSDAPSTSTGSSFGDSLRTAGAERSAPAPETRQSLPSPAAEQVKVKLVKAAEGGLDKIKIQLNPSELGKVEIRLEFGSDGGVRGIVTVEKPETLHLLQRDARQLEQSLQDAGFKTDGEGLEFQMRDGNTNERQQNAGAGNGSVSKAGGDLTAQEKQLDTATAGTEQNGVSEDGSLNMVA